MAVKVTDAKPLKAKIARARAAGKGIEIQEAMGRQLQARINLRFVTKLAPDGNTWPALAESTKAAYAAEDRQRGNGKTAGSLLLRTRLMRQSLTREVGARDVTVGFARPYAKWHELGTRRMPRRGLIFQDPTSGTLSADDIGAMDRVGTAVLAEKINGPDTRT
jgi:phage gpG-like protein